MFDAETIDLIAGAPQLEGVDLASLPQRLTEAYASIVVARLQLRRAQPAIAAEILDYMRRLAYSHEGFVSVLPRREDRASAAFVAGAAHHVTLLAQRASVVERLPTPLGSQGIAPEVSATILFLIAEANADAAELSKSIVLETKDAVEAALLRAVQALADGRLEELLASEIPSADEVLLGEPVSQAVRALYYMLLYGVRGIAAQVLGQDVTTITGPFATDPSTLFENVKTLSAARLEGIFDEPAANVVTLFPGPHHMAALLSAVSKDLPLAALSLLQPPEGVEGQAWSDTLGEIARHRPYLWRNHRQAVAKGYLNRGTSAVISFPTGAGKSTLSELKIAATLLRGETVVFLVPTLSLVDQTTRTLRKVFPHARFHKQRGDEALSDLESANAPQISVLTPERCLTLLSFSATTFRDVGLLVFDECHLLHPKSPAKARRAIDAMLCVLNFTTVAPAADLLLLSAMMKNAEKIAEWLQSISQRRCLALDLTWKPTRQVRGCVVYRTDRIETLKDRLREVRRQVDTKNAPQSLKRELLASPYGLFCLRQTWQSNDREDYALLPLLAKPVLLSTGTAGNKSWYLTPNGNQVAAAIASATASAGMKTLVFSQSVPLANSAVKHLSDQLPVPNLSLTPREARHYETALDEAGGAAYLYLDVDADGNVMSPAAAHHGLLMAAERELHESLFRRADGINALVATSTLAQGMNLPSQVVIIAGDSRFEPEANSLQRLEAHELLNAAGRAGRAGEGSHGFVLIVPSKVVDIDYEKSVIHQHWAELQAIFSQSDQCIEIVDPFSHVMDEVHAAAGPLSEMANYLIRRLPMGTPEDGGTDDSARNLLKRSFGAFLSRRKNEQEWIDARVEAVLLARRSDPESNKEVTWANRLAAAAGVSVALVNELGDWFTGRKFPEAATTREWCDSIFDFFESYPAALMVLVRPESLEGLFGAEYKTLASDAARTRFAIPRLRKLFDGWIRGDTLVGLERTFGTPEQRLGKCESARHFVLRVVPDFAYIASVVGQVAIGLATEKGGAEPASLSLEVLGSCIRDGFDRPEKLALHVIRKRRASRVAIHREFAQFVTLLDPPSIPESFRDVVGRVGRAIRASRRSED